MKKYVLNIDRLYTGATANALVLSQVDENFPVLLPSMPRMGQVAEWVQKCLNINPDFPVRYTRELTRDELNSKIVDFNLELQTQFKEKGHSELYMMDDTHHMKPEEKTVVSEKMYLHSLNGRAEVPRKDEDGKEVRVEVNSSQMNVLFPYRKVSSKSLYSSQISVRSQTEIDDLLETARGITLQGKVSQEKSVQDFAQVGNNLYVMSPNIEIEESNVHIHGNGLTIVNAYIDSPYHFPHSMTLFQPSQEQYDCANLAKEPPLNFRKFIEWYEKYSRRTVVRFSENYGGNVSILQCLGQGSYQLTLGTYSPSGILISDESTNQRQLIKLSSDTYRAIRQGEDPHSRYEDNEYVFDNSMFDKPSVRRFGKVGFMFNMYDTFITGNDRILKMHIPRDKDFNKLLLKFDWKVEDPLKRGLTGDFEATVVVNEEEAFWYCPEDPDSSESSGKFEKEITDTAVSDHDISIVVRIHYAVDFGKRNTEREYRENLMESGVLLNDIRVENGVSDDWNKTLTFGSYVNEPGITAEEFADRYNEFWLVSQYKKNMAYQTVVESPLKNMITSGVKYPNNYSTGDIYGDMFVTKSVLDPRYDMNIDVKPWDNTAMGWKPDGDKLTEDEKQELESHEIMNMLRLEGRDYIGMGACSNQLSLFYKPIDIAIGYEDEWKDLDGDEKKDPDERVFARRVNPETGLNYQMVEVVKNINKFESSIKHKMNVFSVVVENSNLAPDNSDSRDETLEKYKEQLRNSVTQFVRDTCEGIVPVHTQLFDVQFT